MNTYSYLFSGKISFERYEFKVFHTNLFETKPELSTYKYFKNIIGIESYMYDFFTFAAFCLIPATFMFGKRNYK